jgi:hypothetical protein
MARQQPASGTRSPAARRLGGFRLGLAPFAAERNDGFAGLFLEPSQILTHLAWVEVEFGCVLFATLPDLFNDRVAPSCFSLH